jgi:hypothetical protein
MKIDPPPDAGVAPHDDELRFMMRWSKQARRVMADSGWIAPSGDRDWAGPAPSAAVLPRVVRHLTVHAGRGAGSAMKSAAGTGAGPGSAAEARAPHPAPVPRPAARRAQR